MRIEPTDALIVVDLQPDFMPGGALAVPGGDEVAAPIGALAARFSTVVATQDWHPPGHLSFASAHAGRRPFEVIQLYGAEQTLWPDHCVQGSAGAALHPALPDAAVSLILRKGAHAAVDSYSGFRENLGPDGKRLSTGLGGWLRERGIARVFVTGLARDFCVQATAVDAAEAGLSVVLVDDLTRSVDETSRARIDARLAEHGIQQVKLAELT